MLGNVVQHPDEGYVVADSIFNGRNFDIFVLMTDALGTATQYSSFSIMAMNVAVPDVESSPDGSQLASGVPASQVR